MISDIKTRVINNKHIYKSLRVSDLNSFVDIHLIIHNTTDTNVYTKFDLALFNLTKLSFKDIFIKNPYDYVDIGGYGYIKINIKNKLFSCSVYDINQYYLFSTPEYNTYEYYILFHLYMDSRIYISIIRKSAVGEILDIDVDRKIHSSDISPDNDYLLKISDSDGTDVVGKIKTRRGQQKLRLSLLSNYSCQCALCKISDSNLLITSHIKTWIESSKNERIDPTNAILLCVLHDKLLENGYISLSDDFNVLFSRKFDFDKQGISTDLNFRLPKRDIPNLEYLKLHRQKHGF